jgi:hypothetical protein
MRAENAVEEENKQKEKENADKVLLEAKTEEEREEKDEINKIRNHKTAEQTAPWCTNMEEEHMRNIIRWLHKLSDTDPLLLGAIKDEKILDMEEINHGQIEIAGHKQVQDALMGMGNPETGTKALAANTNNRHGWVPHTLIYDWLQDLWEKHWTPANFWNMILHSKQENGQHAYMVKLFPSKGIVMIKANNHKRKSGAIEEAMPKQEQPMQWSKGDKGGGKGYPKGGGWWTNPYEEKQRSMYDAQGKQRWT